jgi:sugar phosphate permease
LTALGTVFGRGTLEMLPVFADAIYSGGPSALAILTSSIGGGAVLAGLVLSRGTAWLSFAVIQLSITVSGLLVIALGVVDEFHVAAVIVAMLGITLSLSGVGSQILIQTSVDDEVRGRVSSFWSMIAFGGTSLGSLLVGVFAHTWGLANATIGAGILCVLITVLSSRLR